MIQTEYQRWLSLLFIVSALTLGGCTSPDSNSAATPPSPAAPTSQPTMQANQPNSMSQLARLEGKATVVMVVKGKPITIEVDGTQAPITAGNFIDLVQRGFYNGLAFHRVVREPEPFVVQGGDPQSKDPAVPPERLGTGGFVDPKTGIERTIPLEIKPADAKQPTYSQVLPAGTPPKLKHTRGAVAMARTQIPDSASSQFYITLADLSFLDGNYAVFGYVTEGMDGVEQIQQGDRIESAQVTQGLENLKLGSN